MRNQTETYPRALSIKRLDHLHVHSLAKQHWTRNFHFHAGTSSMSRINSLPVLRCGSTLRDTACANKTSVFSRILLRMEIRGRQTLSQKFAPDEQFPPCTTSFDDGLSSLRKTQKKLANACSRSQCHVCLPEYPARAGPGTKTPNERHFLRTNPMSELQTVPDDLSRAPLAARVRRCAPVPLKGFKCRAGPLCPARGLM